MSTWSGSYHDWAPRKTAAERRADAARMIADAARRGRAMSPVIVAGRKIALTFWGKAWCDNLERYRDFAYRLERGRSYLRSGSVIDLRIEAGKIVAKVNGSSVYDIAIEIDAVKRDAWRAIQRDCAGGIGSRIDLLSGTLSEPVMVRLCADRTGLFPHPSAIRFTCSCPDYAIMCKHVAAAMYGVGARLDHAPDLLFTLRRVSLDELLASAVTELPATPSASRVLAAQGLAGLFGIELADAAAPPAAGPGARRSATPRTEPDAAPPKPARPGTGGRKARTRSGERSSATPAANTRNAAVRETKLAALANEIASAWKRPALVANNSASRANKPAARANKSAARARPAARANKPATRANKPAARANNPTSRATPAAPRAAPPANRARRRSK